MPDGWTSAPLVIAMGLAAGTLITLAVTIAALGPRTLRQARVWWGHLSPGTPDQARAEIARIAGFRRDPNSPTCSSSPAFSS